MKTKILLALSVLIFSCRGFSPKEKNIYNAKGGIFEKYLYYDSNDTTTYLLTRYYDNGNIQFEAPYSKQLIEGTVKLYDSNGKIDLIRHFVKDKLHGVTYSYNLKTGKLYQENLFINGNMVLLSEHGSSVIKGDTVYGMTYCYPQFTERDTIFLPVGSLTWGKNGKEIPLMNSYFEVFADDTIHVGQNYNLKIVFKLGLHKDVSFDLTVGSLNDKLEFINSNDTKTYKSSGDSLMFEVNDYKVGSNLMLGKINLYVKGEDVSSKYLEHPQVKEYIFYKQFEVVK